ncbi:GapA-binding peptide SR1P [Paenibacillus radicis (ex Xue et al. 2023)]|uniref:GapA-binding peptide SR1P n=1 Tax=Paenibacillus radicis (ex Xue et al. 2023) TaxID=2972489 RepID=A0ABT1YKU6_9BACL|nr:GapA-binding peptide SR1P [Paenibacillus radicis (ex Xue et al. 2023)]MCR8633813.1 GapA-binding peptide SR1P [Paenibacillus radicis (ex Xue et al. 2023)]
MLGVILCKYCGSEIATVDTEKVTIFYSDCKREVCREPGKGRVDE